jgi:hypothetical protein
MLNIERFFQTVPVEEVGFMTITPATHCTAAELQKRFHSFMTGVFGPRVEHYVRVIEWQKGGRPHFHLLIWFKGCDIRTGFNWEYQKARQAIEASVQPGAERVKARRDAKRHYGRLTSSESLRELWRLVERGRQDYGLGRTDLVPIEKNMEAVAKYLGKYLTKGEEPGLRPGEGRRERVRLVVYSKGFPRAASVRFSWWTARAQIYRAKCKRFAAMHGCFSPGQMKEKFGRHWAHNCRAAILATPGEYRGEGVLHTHIDEDGHQWETWGTLIEEVRDTRPELMPRHTETLGANVRRWAYWNGCVSHEEVLKKFGPGWKERYREDIERAKHEGPAVDYRDRESWRTA